MVFEKVRSLIAEQFLMDEDDITMETSLEEDLGADSLDLTELSMALEDMFDFTVADYDELLELKTVGDVVNYISGAIE